MLPARAKEVRPPSSRVALFDPRGETAGLLRQLGIQTEAINAESDLSSFDILIIGKRALSVAGRADIERVRQGLKVVLFEQTAEVLEKRFGFRVAEIWIAACISADRRASGACGHPGGKFTRRCGEATLIPPRLEDKLRPRYGPTVEWPGCRFRRSGVVGRVGMLTVLFENRRGVIFCRLWIAVSAAIQPAHGSSGGQGYGDGSPIGCDRTDRKRSGRSQFGEKSFGICLGLELMPECVQRLRG